MKEQKEQVMLYIHYVIRATPWETSKLPKVKDFNPERPFGPLIILISGVNLSVENF
jgi:hypothetical protein